MERLLANRAAPLLFETEVDSTNTRLRQMAAGGAAEGTVLVAARQSAGRGRLGRSFASPEGGLYLSLLLRQLRPPERNLSLTPAAAVAVCRAVERVCGAACGIKWPNDLQLGGRKLGGILTESFTAAGADWLVLGVGLNVNTRVFPPELEEIAVSLAQALGLETELEALALALTEELDRAAEQWRAAEPALLEAYRARCTTPGQDILIWHGGESRPARALGVNGDFSLEVQLPDGGREALRFGEVTVRGHGGAP